MNPAELEKLENCILCDSSRLKIACKQNRFSQCTECGLIFDNPRPNHQAVVRYYSKADKYDEWLANRSAREALHRRRLRRIRKIMPAGKLLDVGAGVGEFLNQAKRYFEVTGTEISSSAKQIAHELFGLDLKQGTFESLIFNERFDVITMTHVLEHVPHPKETLATCDRWLKPGGILVIAVPNDVDSYWTRRNRRRRKRGWNKYQALGAVGLPALHMEMSELHLSHFTRSVLESSLTKRGYEIVDSGLDPYFSVSGFRKIRRYIRYFLYGTFFKLTGQNLYDTLWVTARKPAHSKGRENA